MNKEEIRLIKGYFNDGYCCDLDELNKTVERLNKIPNYDDLMKENNKLQSNWNSLREWLGKEIPKQPTLPFKSVYEILDKMNELEGGDNENN